MPTEVRSSLSVFVFGQVGLRRISNCQSSTTDGNSRAAPTVTSQKWSFPRFDCREDAKVNGCRFDKVAFGRMYRSNKNTGPQSLEFCEQTAQTDLDVK